ncbi:DUF6470 family protein [Brevibacillus dissolubilis]|uniref:DUF6470 family protein n=1 Tax=Brevibacillus dissolubilis TaxID=1844116 RepID=UPI001116E5C5|nr:DUF6470 family protein [Brevibacillus dissolubilis]
MQIPQLRMQSVFAQLGLQINKPVQEIEQPQAELNLTQEAAILEIRQPKGELTIDTTEGQNNLDLRGILLRTRDNAEYGYQKAMEAIAQISSEGDRLSKIENKGKPIADIAFEESGIYEQTEIMAHHNGGDGIELHYEAKQPEITVEPRGKKMDPVIHKPVHNYTPGKVEAYVNRWNSLTIEVVGLHVDKSL